MPTKKVQLSPAKKKENQATCSELEKLGIKANPEDTEEPKVCFKLEQIDREFARVYDLPHGALAVTLPAKLVVVSSVMFTDADLIPEWDEWPLDLEEPAEHKHFEEFTRDFPAYKPAILNEFLVNRPVPLRPCQREGLIIATGWSQMPAEYPDEKPVKFDLWLRDARDEEFHVDFVARVDRRLKRMYERQRPDALTLCELRAKRMPLFSQQKAEPAVYCDAAASARASVQKKSKPPLRIS